MCTHASARGRVPPMLDVSLPELAPRAEEEVFAYKTRFRVDQRHDVLQLIPEPEGASRLVESAPRPKTACESLVQEPAVCEHVEGRVGCFHLHRAERVLPVLPHRFERDLCPSRSLEATHQVSSVLGVSPHAKPENDLTLFA